MIVFIACTKKKANRECTAKEMYGASALFRYAWRYAKSLNPDKIYILSAKYGLLTEESMIKPYNITLTNAKDDVVRRWSNGVIAELKKEGITRQENAVFLCGIKYRKYLAKYFYHSDAPCAHMGIGKQMKFFKEKLEGKK